jgi:hypothetical protein
MGVKRRRGAVGREEVDYRETSSGLLPIELDSRKGAQEPQRRAAGWDDMWTSNRF